MSIQIDNKKLKELITICYKTNNFKKLAVVSFNAVNNISNQIAIKLGIRPLKNDTSEMIFEYLKMINQVILDSLQIEVFNKEVIRNLKKIEIEFFRKKGKIPKEYIRNMFEIYYDLKKIEVEVPNIFESFDSGINIIEPEINLYSLFSNPQKKKSQGNQIHKKLLLHKLKGIEQSINKSLSKSFDGKLFENAVLLKGVKESLETEDGKIQVKGTLKDNLNYQKSLSNIYGYMFLGAAIMMFLLGIGMIYEATVFPFLLNVLSILILPCFGQGVLFLIIYWNYFQKE